MASQPNSKLFRQEIQFIAGAARLEQIPKLSLPQIAFIGKSNVGKSSLINSLCGRKKLARTSSQPGHTRQINFFSLADKLILTDLPGYGFAKVSQKERNHWQNLIIAYLRLYQQMIFVNLLIDARRTVQEADLAIIALLTELTIPLQIILTKTDKEKISDVSLLNHIEAQLKDNQLEVTNIILTSSKTSHGIRELQKSLTKLALA